ncbi:YslB family protein [Alkalihalobacillus sp. BA299]|uniref:YslB family protein n=1 Tax=Alkalihalobacillus sp. BA299 TaxID=2815938 RepID=UPI001ADBE3CC|nr:YslB family protein [Alkalihalobacillus sp. BA299]
MKKTEQILFNSEQAVPLLGHHLIRNVLMSNLLGKDHENILYWAGKSIAREYPQENIEAVIDFFSKVGWGELSLIKEKKDEINLQLVSPYHKEKITVTYQLEAGFLAQQMESQKKLMTEAIVQEKKDKVLITLKWDLKDPTE